MSYPSSSYWGSTKGGDQSFPRADSLVSLIHHGPSDHRLLIPILIITKECRPKYCQTSPQQPPQRDCQVTRQIGKSSGVNSLNYRPCTYLFKHNLHLRLMSRQCKLILGNGTKAGILQYALT